VDRCSTKAGSREKKKGEWWYSPKEKGGKRETLLDEALGDRMRQALPDLAAFEERKGKEVRVS